MNFLNYIFLIGLILILSCSSDLQTSDNGIKTIITKAQSYPGGPEEIFDMPIHNRLDAMRLANQEDDIQMKEDDLILGITHAGNAFAIPIKYLSGFEVANISIDSMEILISWCPLVGTGRIFNISQSNSLKRFDFGRGLINNNLILIDRKSKSVWNQLSGKCIQGDKEGQTLSPLSSIQCTWKFWQRKYPKTNLFINPDTSGAVFPALIMKDYYYNLWTPGNPYPQITFYRT